MDLMPKVCRQCGGQMSTPIAGRRTGLLISTCRDCGESVHSATPVVAERVTPAPGQQLLPPPPPIALPRAGALARFERAHGAGDSKKAIARAHRDVRRANARDSRLKQLGRDA